MSNWTDERIAEELGTIANENFDYLVVLRMATTIVPLMRKMRDELAAELNETRATYDTLGNVRIEKLELLNAEYIALSDATVQLHREIARLLKENEFLAEENKNLIGQLVEMRQIQDELTADSEQRYDALYNKHYALLAWAKQAMTHLNSTPDNDAMYLLRNAPEEVQS